MRKVTISSLKKKLDKVFSEFIRKRGEGVCFTCGLKRTWKEMQSGHFISRQHSATRYNELNCQSQCPNCNIWRRGNIAEFSARIIERFGLEEYKSLIKLGRTTKQFTCKELEELIHHYAEFNS